MYIDENSLIINGVNMGKYVSEVEFGFNKLWGKDSGRNLKGSMKGSLLNIFPKLRLKFVKLTREELEILAPILDSETQTTTYYDPKLRRLNTIETYTGDWATTNKNIFSNVARANEPFNISVIATEGRD